MAAHHASQSNHFSATRSPARPALARRRLWRAAAAVLLAAAAPLAVPALAAAQADTAPPEVENSRQSFQGVLTANALVYSGPGLNYYPTMRLKEGSTVVVTGIKKDWLKVVPPEGSFSYVPKAFVQLYGNGRQGKVTNRLIVKAGSGMQPVKWAVQAQLDQGADVTILGEEDEYFKVKPPEGAYLYLSKDAVKPGAPVARATGNGAGNGNGAGAPLVAPPPPAQGTEVRTTPPAGGDATATGNNGAGTGSGAAGVPGGTAGAAVLPPPTTQGATAGAAPAGNPADSLAQLQKLEDRFAEMSKQPLVDQPVGELLGEYQKLGGNPGLPDMARRIVDVRVTTLRVRSEAKDQFAAVQKQQQEFEDKIKVHDVEKREIEERIKQIDIQLYAAVGTLRTSSLQVARTPLYRLTDPQTGRTLVYVWGTDPKVGQLLGQFVGIKGPMQTDNRLNLKVVTPTATDVVDPNKVNDSVAAEIIPPSLLPKAGTASTDGQ